MITLYPGLRTEAALAAIAAGEQVLELWPKSYTMGPNVPRCFQGKDFAKLYDDDATRLFKTARMLGVKVIKIDCPGQPGRQHVDLVGGPMRRAIGQAKRIALESGKATAEPMMLPFES